MLNRASVKKQTKNTKRIAVYTAIFGAYDNLIPQPSYPDVDYICFTDQPFKSDTWDIRYSDPIPNDPTRSSRIHKILPHKYLADYDISIFIDGNYIITKDVNQLIDRYLTDEKMLIFDHAQCSDARDCVYDEYDALVEIGKQSGKFKDDPEVMKDQIDRYRKDGYPDNNGLIFSAVLVRRHHDAEVMGLMEAWWHEVNNYSKRDQLSFNYVAWKSKFQYKFLDGDLRNHEYFFMLAKHGQNFKKKYLKYRLKKFFGFRPKR